MVASAVNQSPAMDCVIQACGCMPSDSYPRRRKATAVVDCSVDQSAVVDFGFTVA